MALSNTPMVSGGGVKFQYVVTVVPKETDKIQCPKCKGTKQTGGWMEEVKECSECFGHGVSRKIYGTSFDLELENYLVKCLDEFLIKKRDEERP